MFFMSFIFTCHSLMNAVHVIVCFSHNDYFLLKDSLLTMLCSHCDFFNGLISTYYLLYTIEYYHIFINDQVLEFKCFKR